MPGEVDPRLFGLHVGYVTDRNDPKGLKRVRVRVPGLVEPASAWAWPLGTTGGGSPDRGGFITPAKGAAVGVLFHLGNVDHPYYLCGWWGRPGGSSEVPSPAREGPATEDVHVLETDLWRVTMDDRPAKKSLVIENKETGDKLEWDGLAAGILLDAKVALVLKCVGVLNIQAGQVVINGRVVRPGTDPI